MRLALVAFLLLPVLSSQDAAVKDLASVLPRGASIYFDVDGFSDAAARIKNAGLFTGAGEETRKRIDGILDELAAMKVSRAALVVMPAIVFDTHWVLVAESGAPEALLATVAKWRGDGAKTASAEVAPFTVVADCSETIDLVRDLRAGKGKSLADREDFRQFRTRYPKGSARVHLQVDKLAPKIARAFLDSKDDAGAVLMFSHVLHAVKTARVLSGAADLVDGFGLELTADVDPVPEARAFAASRPTQPVLVPPEGTSLRVSLARDVGKFWNQRATVLSEAARAPLAEFQNNLSLLMGGLSVEDVFAGLGTAFDFYVGRGDPAAPAGRRYPSAALVAVLADPALKTEFLLSFQTTIGIVNAQRTQEGQPRFLQESIRHRDVLIACARLLPESLAEKTDEGSPSGRQAGRGGDDRLQLEPSFAAVGDRLIFGSNRKIVEQLVEQVLDGRFQPRRPGDDAELSAKAASEALSDVAGWLKSRMTLKEGRTDAEAQKVLDAVLAVLRRMEQARISLDVGPKLATFEARVLARKFFESAPESR